MKNTPLSSNSSPSTIRTNRQIMLSLGQLYLLIIMYFVGRSDETGDVFPSRSHFAASATMVKKTGGPQSRSARMKSMILIPVQDFSNAFSDTVIVPIHNIPQHIQDSPEKPHALQSAPNTSDTYNVPAPNFYKKVLHTKRRYLPLQKIINYDRAMRCSSSHPQQTRAITHKNIPNISNTSTFDTTLLILSKSPTMAKASTKPTVAKRGGAPAKATVTLTSLGRTRSASRTADQPVTEGDPLSLPVPEDPDLDDLEDFQDPENREEGEKPEKNSSDELNTTAETETSFDSANSEGVPSTDQFINEHINAPNVPEDKDTTESNTNGNAAPAPAQVNTTANAPEASNNHSEPTDPENANNQHPASNDKEEDQDDLMDTDSVTDPKSPSASPVKKKSKRSALNSIITPTAPPPNPKPTPSTSTANSVPKAASKVNDKAMNKGPAKGKDEKKEGVSKESSKTSKKPAASAMKEGKYSKPSPKIPAKAPYIPHDHAYKRIVVEGSVDFSKDALSHIPTNGKKVAHAITVLHKNMCYVDHHAQINSNNPLKDIWIGNDGVRVPDNITMLQDYVLNMNLRQFKPSQAPKDALDSLGGNSGKKQSKNMYFSFYLSCDKEPTKLIEQVGFEWCEFGTFLRVKELQAMETITPILLYNVCAMVPRQTIQHELTFCLNKIKEDMMVAEDILASDVSFVTATSEPPQVNVRHNVAHVPKAKSSQALMKLPRHLQQCRRAYHLEVSASKADQLKELVRYGKKKGFFKEYLGPHTHPSEVMTWESSANDTKRAEQVMKSHVNYNASMTCTDVFGFHDINARVTIPGQGQQVSGRFCIISLIKLRDGASAIAEVHQEGVGGLVSLVHPNIPEAENLAVNFAKHPAAFLLNMLKESGVDESFVMSLLSKMLDPSLVHEAEHCKWDSETRSVVTPEELEEEEESEKFGEQSWFKDIVAQYEEHKQSDSRKSKNYASAAALYDLDAAKSVKTTHEENDDLTAAEELEETSAKKTQKEVIEIDDVSSLGGRGSVFGGEEANGRQGEMSSEDENSLDDFLSGNTPRSGRVRFSDGKNDGAGNGSDDSSSVVDVTPQHTAAASAAERHEPSETGSTG
eukprot:scaffold13929_cov79-Cyclotella_meneghiniana.AAC.5